MTSIWKAIRLSRKDGRVPNSNSKLKHEKLYDEIIGDGSTLFHIQYLGCIPVENSSGAAINNAAIKRIMALSRIQGTKNAKPVTLFIKPEKIIIDLEQTKSSNKKKKPASSSLTSSSQQQQQQHSTTIATKQADDDPDKIDPIEISLNRVSYCFVDSAYDRVIAFVATNDHGCHECHAFLTNKSKIAKNIALTISKAFINAYEKWFQHRAVGGSSYSTNGTGSNSNSNVSSSSSSSSSSTSSSPSRSTGPTTITTTTPTTTTTPMPNSVKTSEKNLGQYDHEYYSLIDWSSAPVEYHRFNLASNDKDSLI